MEKKIIMAITMLITATAISVCEKEVVVASANMTNLTTILDEQSAKATKSVTYTFTDLSATMYATSNVNVRNLPSTDGTRLGALSKNQSVTITGQCNETGWYRIVYNDAEAFVSNKYLSDASNILSGDMKTISDEQAAIVEKAMESLGMGVTYVDTNTGLTFSSLYDIIAYLEGNGSGTSSGNTGSNSNLENGFRKDVAQEIWNLVNAERTAAGLSALAWDDTVYEFACSRAQAIVTDYSHNGYHDGSHGENILKCSTVNANEIHKIWYNSSGHHDNYMSQSYASGACAVYVYNGSVYAVENFKHPDDGKTYYPVGYDSYNDYKNMKSYTASNGVIVRIQDGGGICVYDEENPGVTTEMKEIAVNEYGLGLAVTDAELNAMRTGSSTSTPS